MWSCRMSSRAGLDQHRRQRRVKKTNEIQRNRQEPLAEKARLKQQAARATVRDLFDRWVSLELAQRKESSRKELVRAFEKDVLPLIG